MNATADGFMFKEILNEMREHTLKRLTNPYIGNYVPSTRLYKYYMEVRSLPLPVSNSDELDDAVNQTKSTANDGATNMATNSRNGITDATNSYQGSQNQDDFKSRMEASRQKALNDSADSINATYKKAEDMGETLSPDQQNVLFATMDTLNAGFHTIWKSVSGFVLDAVKAVVDFIDNAMKKIGDFFGGVFSDIKSIF